VKNPKTAAGLVLLLILTAGIVFMGFRLAPTIRETRREMSLTPTPEPEETAPEAPAEADREEAEENE
jgi:hypothetical protein